MNQRGAVLALVLQWGTVLGLNPNNAGHSLRKRGESRNSIGPTINGARPSTREGAGNRRRRSGWTWQRTTWVAMPEGEFKYRAHPPTLQAHDAQGPGDASRVGRFGTKHGGRNLQDEVKLWPTPSANEGAAGTPNGKMQKMLGNHPDVRGQGPGSLNPTWVEGLMGFPLGWTDLSDGD